MTGAPRRAAAWLPLVAWMALIFVLSAQPDLRFVEEPDADFVVRKIGHMAVFGILALLAWRALAMTTDVPRPWLLGAAFAIVYAATDEIHQGFTAGRHPSVVDVGIDTIGIAAAVVVATLVVRARRRRAGQGDPPGGSGPKG